MENEMKTYKDANGNTISGAWKRYRKLPVVVEATGPIEREEDIVTLNGTVHVSVGEFIIRGVKGELYPCKPDIFAKTYEAVSETSVESLRQIVKAQERKSAEVIELLKAGTSAAAVRRQTGASLGTIAYHKKRLATEK